MYNNNEKSAPVATGAQPAYYNAQKQNNAGKRNNILFQQESQEYLAEKIFKALGGRRLGNKEWMCHCPVHSDRNPSLHVVLKEGKILLYCHAGCSQQDVIESLKNLGLWPRKQNGRNNNIIPGVPDKWPVKGKGKKKTLVSIWKYFDPQSKKNIGIVARYGSKEKEIVPFFQRWENGTWKAGLGEKHKKNRPWYCLEKLNNNVRKVVIVEGEKCADAINAKRLPETIAITWQGGTNAVEKVDYSILIEILNNNKTLEQIFFWPDADVVGVQAMQKIWKRLKNKITSLMYVIDPQILLKNKGWDVADFLKEQEQENDIKEIEEIEEIESTGQVHIREATEEEFEKLKCEAGLLEAKVKYFAIQKKLELEKDKKKVAGLEETERELRKIIQDKIAEYMNRNFAFVNDGQIVFLDRRKNKIIPKQSLELLLANLRLPFNPTQTWIQHPKRHTYYGITFTSGTAGSKYNMFRGWPIEPKPLPCTNFLNFVREVICKDEKITSWVLDWLAHLFQHPEKKEESTVAIALRGLKGTGKNFFANHVLELTGYRPDTKRYGILIDQEELIFGRFKEHLLGKVLCVLDEVVWGGNKRNESQLKSLITSDTIIIEPKGRKPFVTGNYLRFIFLGNESWMVPSSMDERRFLVLDVSPIHRKDYKYFSHLEKMWNNGEREGFLYFLLSRKITHNLREAPWTEGLKDQIMRSLEPHQEWILEALDEGKFVITRHDTTTEIPWQTEIDIPISTFYESYLCYVSARQKQRFALSKRALKREIERFLQCEIQSVQNSKKTQRLYRLPDPAKVKYNSYLIKFFDEAPF